MNMQNIIEVEKRVHYGSEYIYPINDQAVKACELLGAQKTLTPLNIVKLKAMGFVIRQVMTANGKQMTVGEL